jgi:hypothetical protein
MISDSGSGSLSSEFLTSARRRRHTSFNSVSWRLDRTGRSMRGESGRKFGDSGSPRYFLSILAI